MSLRVGAGAGAAFDRIAPAKDLAERGGLDFLCFECLAERTLAQGHSAMLRGSGSGYNRMLRARLEAMLATCLANRTRIVTNMGSADPRGAGEAAAVIARELGLKGVRIGVVEGDDVSHLIDDGTLLPELGRTVGELGRRIVGANAYLGAEAIVPALAEGADLVITGRVADPSLFVAPIAHHFGWALDDWTRLARATTVGHLLECTTQVTGGYFADPGFKDVPGLADLGYPLAEVEGDGAAVITKLDGTGGCVTELTVKEQLLYEVHDPRAYLTPDVSADFSRVRLGSDGKDRIRVFGAEGRPRPPQLKALVAFDGGFLAEAEFSYGGPGAQARAELARAIVHERMIDRFGYAGALRLDLIGVNAIHATAVTRVSDSQDVRLRAALRSPDRRWAELLLEEVEGLWMAGPAGGGGFRGTITPGVITQPTFIDRERVATRVTMLTS